jgi:glycosyltransferase 2 family protein
VPASDRRGRGRETSREENALATGPLRQALLNWKIVIPLVLALAVLLAFGVYVRPRELADALRGFDLVWLVPILGLAFLNYVVRFFRWQYYLRVVGLRVETRRSLGIFFSGLAMSVTPGKIGELFKCLMLKREIDAPYARSVPVVINERLTDLVAIVVLAGLGVARYPTGRVVFAAGVAAMVVAIVVLAFSPHLAERLGPWLAHRFAREGMADSATEMGRVFVRLLRPGPLALGTLLGVGAWFAECVAFRLVFVGLGYTDISLFEATFIYALATLAGAVSFLPGGLGVTEATMAGLLALFEIPKQTAAAATLIIRACTLWFAVALGVVSYALHMRRYGGGAAVSPDGDRAAPPPAASPPETSPQETPSG